MRFAEVFLRLGVALVGWLVIIAYLLWLAIVPQTPCNGDEASLWQVLLYAVPVVLMFAALLNASQQIPAIHETLRWLSVPALLLSLLAARTLFATFMSSTLGTEPVCGLSQTGWSSLWAPVHALVFMVLAVQFWRGRPARAIA